MALGRIEFGVIEPLVHASGFLAFQSGEVGPACRGEDGDGLAGPDELVRVFLRGDALGFLPKLIELGEGFEEGFLGPEDISLEGEEFVLGPLHDGRRVDRVVFPSAGTRPALPVAW